MAGNVSPFHGKVARVEKNSVVMDFTEGWEIATDLDMDDISRQGQNWKEGLPGQAAWAGTFSGQTVLGNTEQAAIFDNIINATPGTKLTDMNFNFEDTGDYLSGNIYITNVTFTNNVGGKAAFTVSFVGDGALSKTIA
ncbi:MAG: hypothetical protein KAT70_00435 [Thermoplasmata archaeon]|nr:hypothetical protein [Thermoplasmata archaeon]